MSKSVGVKKKSIWRDKASWELLMLCVPTPPRVYAVSLRTTGENLELLTAGEAEQLNLHHPTR